MEPVSIIPTQAVATTPAITRCQSSRTVPLCRYSSLRRRRPPAPAEHLQILTVVTTDNIVKPCSMCEAGTVATVSPGTGRAVHLHSLSSPAFRSRAPPGVSPDHSEETSSCSGDTPGGSRVHEGRQHRKPMKYVQGGDDCSFGRAQANRSWACILQLRAAQGGQACDSVPRGGDQSTCQAATFG